MLSKIFLNIFLFLCVVCLAIILLIDSKVSIRILNSLELNMKKRIFLNDDFKNKFATASDIKENHRIEMEANEFSDPSKWNIILTVNHGYIDIFNNWLWYFKRLDIKVNVTVIAEDDLVIEKLRKKKDTHFLNIVRSWISNVSEPLDFASTSYKKLLSARPTYILRYLQAGNNVLFSDIDTVWLQNPFSFFREIYDIWGQSEAKQIRVCAGFIALRSNARTIRLVDLWQEELRRKPQLSQPAFNRLVRQQNISVNHLDEGLFIGGLEASNMTFEQLHSVAMVHATFCLGLENKRNCLKGWNLWYGN